MMKRVSIAFLAGVYAASAAPLVVWTSSEQSAPNVHTSSEAQSADIFGELLRSDAGEASLAGVVFVLGRNGDGSEGLSYLASEGSLPEVSSKYSSANCLHHHHVAGIQSGPSVVRDLARGNAKHSVLEVSMSEFENKLASLNKLEEEAEVSAAGSVSKTAGKRARQLKKANVLVVKVDASTDPSAIDNAVASAIDNTSVATVVLTSVRAVAEVKLEREMLSRKKLEAMQKAGRRLVANKARRLEDADGDDGNNNNNDDLSGVYYVSMTPNIFAGLLFFFMFATTTYIGITCMGQIQGQDVYVSKMPAIGREA
jgi:hypothetical protein